MAADAPIFLPEVHALFLRPFLDEARDSLGDDKLQELIRSFGVAERDLRNPTAWVSLAFCEKFCDVLYTAGMDPAVFERCGRRVLTPQYLGILRPLFRAFGTPAFTYLQVAQATPRFNKVGWMKILERRPGYVKLEYSAIPGAPRERSGLVCRARAAQLAAIPTMFDLKPARAAHPACMYRGDATCVYEFTWQEPAGKLLSRLGLLGGALGGGAAVLAGGHGLAATAGAGAAAALALWSAARVFELKREIGSRASEIYDYHDALTRSASAHEERYVELLDTKAEVERKVRELAQANDRLAVVLREMQALKDAERMFFANVSHDLRTPLTLILAPLGEVLARHDLSGDTRRALETIRKNAEQLRKLIDQLLEMEKIEAGRAEISRAPTDPVALLRGLGERFSAAAAANGIALEVEAPPRMAPLPIDGFSIESALSNLAANAFRFAHRKVSLRLAERDGAVVFEVRDDGDGIAPQDLHRIFDRFAQVGDTARRKSGTGLGLALAREAARLHEGTLTVASLPGEGATFTLTLPRLAPAADGGAPAAPVAPSLATARPPGAGAAAAHTPLPAPLGPPPASFAGPDPHAPLVLVVEDDDDLRGFLGEILSARYRVETARDGAEGLAAARRLRPDGIVSDLAMPVLDGLELCRRVRDEERGARTPIILLTARAQLARVLEGFEAGADDYVTKPFHAPELLARVGVHVLLGRLLKEIAHKERLATLGMVAASVAHQVRNPLSALQNTVESLKERVEGAPRTEGMFDLIEDCAGRIEKLTNDLLDLSRVDREEAARFRPAEGIRACVRVVSAQLPTQTRIVTDLDEELEIEGRPGDLNHVFLNLIDNAARAVAGQGTVMVRSARAGDCFELEVADSGPGVPDQDCQVIFQPFYSTRAAGEGTGLGLFLVSKVVGAHGGSVSVGRSDLGGASFLIRIPRSPESPGAPAAPQRTPAQQG